MNQQASDKLDQDKVYSTQAQLDSRRKIAQIFDESPLPTHEKLGAAFNYSMRQDISLFLARYELFKKTEHIKGSIVEGGVYYGNGLMSWYHLSSALEPINYNRRIIGFDTFEGSTRPGEKDQKSSEHWSQPDYAIDSQKEIEHLVQTHDENRFLNHIPKVELVRGDMCKTIPEYLHQNPHTMVSLLCLSVNLFDPTAAALKHFLPRMPKGAIVAIHTLNESVYPGATQAVLECANLRNAEIRCFEYAPNLAYFEV